MHLQTKLNFKNIKLKKIYRTNYIFTLLSWIHIFKSVQIHVDRGNVMNDSGKITIIRISTKFHLKIFFVRKIAEILISQIVVFEPPLFQTYPCIYRRFTITIHLFYAAIMDCVGSQERSPIWWASLPRIHGKSSKKFKCMSSLEKTVNFQWSFPKLLQEIMPQDTTLFQNHRNKKLIMMISRLWNCRRL
jgi:hypothetical protein